MHFSTIITLLTTTLATTVTARNAPKGSIWYGITCNPSAGSHKTSFTQLVNYPNADAANKGVKPTESTLQSSNQKNWKGEYPYQIFSGGYMSGTFGGKADNIKDYMGTQWNCKAADGKALVNDGSRSGLVCTKSVVCA